MVIRGHLGRPALHIFIRYRRQRHKFPALLIPVVTAAVRLLGEGRIIEFVQMSPKVSVEPLQAEVVHFLHVVEETFLQDTNGILYRTLVLRLPDLGWKNNRVVMLGPFSVILVQFRGDPVPIGNDSLLAVVTDNQCRYAAQIRQSMNGCHFPGTARTVAKSSPV